jgi:DNA-binding CsgD family transcriptional regulator/tetratricopeptide (TPR) repeat protein
VGDLVAASAVRLFVGRERELARVDAALAGVAEGQGRVVFVTGHMGKGKTRLAEEALDAARRRGFVVLVGRTPAAGSGLAYAPLLAAFGSVLRATEPSEREALVADLPRLGRLWPELHLPPPPPLQEPELERALLFEAVARLVERLAGGAPMVLFVDDLHWADAPSLALLGYLVPTLAALPVLLIGTYRPEGASGNKALRQFATDVRRAGIGSELPLEALDAEAVATLMAGILGGDPPAALLELAAGAGGTPLFVEALVRGLVEAGGLVRTADGWTMAEGATTLPREVRDLVADRLDLLSDDERSTVELIAHSAQGLPHDLLEDVAGLEPGPLLDVIRRLAGAGLVIQDEDGSDVTYRLAHPFIGEVVVGNLPAVARRRLHARLARTGERLRPADLDLLAYHYSRAGREVDEHRARDVLLDAGERAHELAAHDEAARHFGAALPFVRDGKRPDLLAHVLERMGESWEPLGETAAAMAVWTEACGERQQAGDVRGVARIRRRLAFAAQAGGDLSGARQHLVEGIEALRELPPSDELVDLYAARQFIDTPLVDPERAREVLVELGRLAEVLDSPRATAEARLAEASLLWMTGWPGNPVPLAEEAARIAADAGEWLLARRAHRERAWIGFVGGDPAMIRYHCRAQADIDDRLGDAAHRSGPLLQLSCAELLAGDFDQSVALAEEAVAHARRYGQRRMQAMSLGQLAAALIHRGALDAAEHHVGEACEVYPEVLNDPRGGRYFVIVPKAMLALERGDTGTVIETAWMVHTLMHLNLTGTAQLAAGDLDGTLATAEALQSGWPWNPYTVAQADRLVGLVHLARGEAEAGRRLLECSAVALDALGLPFEAALSRLHLGTVDSVRRALAAFEAMGAARYVDRARRALRTLGVRPPAVRRRGVTEPLSRRELEVAGLVAKGLTNAEIAEQLVLSVRTVETHLAHIYGRLGLSSRAALAVWVTEATQATT